MEEEETVRRMKVRWLRHTYADLSVSSIQFWNGAPNLWQPPINAFRCAAGVCICVDLAGVDKSLIDLTVEPRRVIIRGSRETPEPSDQTTQVLALEIDYGPFEREVRLPAEVDVKRARAEQENGLLWIHLPLKK
jgi:HSP20 family molecular chaperone IbpA